MVSYQHAQLALGILFILTAVTYLRFSHIRLRRNPDFSSRFQNRFSSSPYVRDDGPIIPQSPRYYNNRALVTHIPVNVTDGLGHRFLMLNAEVLLAVELNVGYVHRRSRYGSLTPPSDRLAVDRFLGFATNTQVIRRNILSQTCSNITKIFDNCRAPTVVCTKLRKREEGGLFDHLVFVPTNISECYARVPTSRHKECTKQTRKFVENHAEPNTLFQTVPGGCAKDWRTNNWTYTGSFFQKTYWRFHGSRPTTPPSRNLTLDPQFVQIAVHVRRGDFLTYKNREMIPDEVFADVVCRIKGHLDKEAGVDVNTMLNLYSEGLARGHIPNNHDVKTMRPVYVTEKGVVAEPGHWNKLLAARCTRPPDVRLHIATHTITALHDMISADFFVGSRSGMSMQIVALLARGTALLPTKRGARAYSERYGRHVAFSWDRSSTTASLPQNKLRKRVAEFVRQYRQNLISARNS